MCVYEIQNMRFVYNIMYIYTVYLQKLLNRVFNIQHILFNIFNGGFVFNGFTT